MVNAAGSLFKACVDGDAAYVELLINNGMSPNTCDYNQRTPLHLAASNGHTHIVHFLCNQVVGHNNPTFCPRPPTMPRKSCPIHSCHFVHCPRLLQHHVLCLSSAMCVQRLHKVQLELISLFNLGSSKLTPVQPTNIPLWH